MPVNAEKASYKKQTPIWQKCRDVVEGQEQMHDQGTLYLPRLTGQTDAEYIAYLRFNSRDATSVNNQLA